MKREVAFVLSVLAYKPVSISNKLDWAYIMQFLQDNRIAGVFLKKAKDANIKLPDEVYSKLIEIFERQEYRVRFMRGYIADMGVQLDAAGVDYAFLKGSILTHTRFAGLALYADGERVSNDIDILVRPKDITRITKVLTELGYRQGYWDKEKQVLQPFSRAEIIARRMNRGETAPLILPTVNPRVPFVEADINFSVDYLPTGKEELVEAMLNSKTRYYGSNYGLKSLTPEWFFIHLVLHYYKESVLYFMAERGKESAIYKLLDMYYLMREMRLDWYILHKLTQQNELQEPMGYVLSYINKLFGCKMPEWIKEPDCEPLVVDPPTGRKFKWTVSLQERTGEPDRLRFLREITENA